MDLGCEPTWQWKRSAWRTNRCRLMCNRGSRRAGTVPPCGRRNARIRLHLHVGSVGGTTASSCSTRDATKSCHAVNELVWVWRVSTQSHQSLITTSTRIKAIGNIVIWYPEKKSVSVIPGLAGRWSRSCSDRIQCILACSWIFSSNSGPPTICSLWNTETTAQIYSEIHGTISAIFIIMMFWELLWREISTCCSRLYGMTVRCFDFERCYPIA